MSKRAGNLLSQSQEREADITVEEYRGLAVLLIKAGDDWMAEKIVIDAGDGVEWQLPALPFPNSHDAGDYARRIIDTAFPREQFGDRIESVLAADVR